MVGKMCPRNTIDAWPSSSTRHINPRTVEVRCETKSSRLPTSHHPLAYAE